MKTLRVTNPPMRGPDVRQLQTLLIRRGTLIGRADGYYGTATAAAVYRAKLELGYPKPDHVAGDTLISYLNGHRRPTAAMKRAAAKRRAVKKTTPGTTSASSTKHKPTKADLAAVHETRVRAEAVTIMHLLLNAEPRVHYRQARPMRTNAIRNVAQLEQALRTAGIYFDCSESSTTIARLAGALDPNGQGFNGVGFTGTILSHCKTITKSQLKPGDLVVFGPGTGHHVCMVLAGGSDPLLFSHGQEKGPIAIRLSVEARFQAAPTRYRRLPI